MVQLRSVSGAARLQWTNEGHSIFSLHKLQKGGDSRFPHAMEPRLCCRCSVHNLYGVVEVRGQPHVSFFIFFSFWDRLCWSTDYPLGYTECPAIPRLGLQAHTSMPGLIMQFLRDGTGPCVYFPLRCLSISKLLFVDWVKCLSILLSQAFSIHLIHQRAGYAGPWTLVLWLVLHGNHPPKLPI